MLLFVILLWAVCQLIWALFQGARGDMFQVRVVISLFGAAYGRKKPKPVQTSVSGWALRPENHKPVYGKHASNWIKAKQTAVLDLKTWQECRHWHRVRNIHNTAKARARVSNRLIVVTSYGDRYWLHWHILQLSSRLRFKIRMYEWISSSRTDFAEVEYNIHVLIWV